MPIKTIEFKKQTVTPRLPRTGRSKLFLDASGNLATLAEDGTVATVGSGEGGGTAGPQGPQGPQGEPGESGVSAPIEVTITDDYVLTPPEGTFMGGDRVKFHLHAVGADRNLKFSGIAIPTDSTFDNSVGKTLLENRIYLVQLEYLCSAQWGLTSLVGGYY